MSEPKVLGCEKCGGDHGKWSCPMEAAEGYENMITAAYDRLNEARDELARLRAELENRDAEIEITRKAAGDEIARLRAENRRLREFVGWVAAHWPSGRERALDLLASLSDREEGRAADAEDRAFADRARRVLNEKGRG